MKIPINTRIIGTFLGQNIAEAFNISQIAKATGAAYPHVHAAVHELITANVLLERQIGKSIYCSLNLANIQTRILLQEATLAFNRKQQTKVYEELDKLYLNEPRILSALLKKNGAILIVQDKAAMRPILKQTAMLNISFYTEKEFLLHIEKDVSSVEAQPVVGADRYYLLLNEIHDQLILNFANLYRRRSE